MRSKLPFRNQVGEHQDNNNYEIKLATCNKYLQWILLKILIFLLNKNSTLQQHNFSAFCCKLLSLFKNYNDFGHLPISFLIGKMCVPVKIFLNLGVIIDRIKLSMEGIQFEKKRWRYLHKEFFDDLQHTKKEIKHQNFLQPFLEKT